MTIASGTGRTEHHAGKAWLVAGILSLVLCVCQAVDVDE